VRNLIINVAISAIVALPGPAETNRPHTKELGTFRQAAYVKTGLSAISPPRSNASPKHKSANMNKLELDPVGAVGMASWYGEQFNGRPTANGEIFDMNGLSAAHLHLPLGSWIKVTNLSNRRSLVLRINDRGPYAMGRVLDLSKEAARRLGFIGAGMTMVEIHTVKWTASHAKPQPAAIELAPPLPSAPEMSGRLARL